MINIQQLLCTVIKFHVVKEAKGEDFQVNFWQLNVLFLIDYSTYFKDVMQYCYSCQFSPVSA